MFEGALRIFRDRVRRGDFIITLHADDERVADDLSGLDVEAAIRSGQIVERQRDRTTRELKYVIRRMSLRDEPLCVVVKISPIGRMVDLTVYRA